MKLNNRTKRIFSIIALFLILMNSFQGIVSAVEINSAHIEDLGKCEYHLQYRKTADTWSYIITTMTGYRVNGVLHYAYCINPHINGVGETSPYTVSVSQVLSDARIWRIITNGFPYKSPAELGVANEQDAFVATKQAIYAVLENRDVDSYYRGADDRGIMIFNALKNLVNIGRYGTQTPSNTSVIHINKIGELKADANNYYSQEYFVSSGIEISNYTVTGISNFPEGTYVADMNNNSKNTFAGGEHFKVLIPKNKIVNNFDGIINVNGSVKSYPVFYGASNNPSLQDYALTYHAYTTESGQTTLSVDAYKSKLEVLKIDAETKQALEGVEFNFRYEDGQNIGNYTTNSAGKIVLQKLRPGKVIGTEIKTREEYILNTDKQEVVLEYADTKSITVTNEHKRGDLKVYKIDADNNRIALGGVKFALYSYEFDKIVGHYVTSADGEILIESLRTGDWALIEEETNKWYNLTDPVDVKVEWNVVTDAIVENELKKSQIKIIKVDEEDNEIKLKDVVFDVLDEKGKVLETIKTNEDGEAVTSRYVVRDHQLLYIQEKITNEKYVLDDTIHEIELKENEIVTVTFENRKIKGQVKVIKTAEDDNKITGDKKGTPIPNVSFDVYDENKTYIEKIKTGEDGTAITSLLEKGIKYVKESSEGIEWYLLNTNEYSAEIVNDGDIIELHITNIPEDPNVDIEKEGIIQTTANQEIKYDFSIKNTGNTELDNFVWTDVLPTDYVTVTRLITGTYNQDLNYSIYYKTNKNDYRLLKENLNTQTNNYIDFSSLQLDADEYVTEFKTDFGTVDVGFENVEKPQLFVEVKDTVKNDDVFTNKTRIEGYNKTYLVWDEDDHTTKVYEKKIELKLPRTGC